MARFFINVDHVATVRQARRAAYPDPVRLAQLAEDAGVHGVTIHLREDRRHIQDHDVDRLKKVCRTPFNFELATSDEVVKIALRIRPEQATLVPERREEITTEGGLDLERGFFRIRQVTSQLQSAGIAVSLFINPDISSIERSIAAGATHVELHTGRYCDAHSDAQQIAELERIREMAAYGLRLGLVVNAGHGLNYQNTAPIAAIPGINDLNIGHAIVARALETGIAAAVREMLAIIQNPLSPPKCP